MRERTWQILPCSAKTGEGLQEGKQYTPLLFLSVFATSTVVVLYDYPSSRIFSYVVKGLTLSILCFDVGMEWLVEQINSGKDGAESKN